LIDHIAVHPKDYAMMNLMDCYGFSQIHASFDPIKLPFMKSMPLVFFMLVCVGAVEIS
jgi:hypothetical protein